MTRATTRLRRFSFGPRWPPRRALTTRLREGAGGCQRGLTFVEVLEAVQVENARAKGWSWQAIAARLGVTKQAVHKKYAGRRFGFGR